MENNQFPGTSLPENQPPKKGKVLIKKVVQKYLLIFLVFLAFVAGLMVDDLNQNKTIKNNIIKETAGEISNLFSGVEGVDPALFSESWDIIHQYYIERGQISEKDLFYGALSGMIAAIGDPYSIFFDPKISAEFNQELDGSFFGIGAEIGRKNGYLVIIAPLADTPADKAGLRPGDKILAVDGLDMSGVSVDEAINLIRGEKDQAVILTVLSKEESIPREVSVVRGKIEIPSVAYRLEDDIGIIEVTNFNSDTASRFTKIAQNVLQDNPRGIILDLRNNPGGYLNIAVDLAGSWLEPGQIVVREMFSDQRMNQDYESEQQVDLSNFPTVVLVNEGSASAAEILAGALQDYQVAQIVGQTTFGKGSVQQLFNLGDNSSIKLTVAKWLTPLGRTIDEQGIEPDILVDFTLEDYNNDLDPQLDKAKELILE